MVYFKSILFNSNIIVLNIMVETTNNNDLLVKLQAEGDWNMTAVFNDKQTMITQNKCTLGKDEIE